MNILIKHPIILKPINQTEASFLSKWSDFINEVNKQYAVYAKFPKQTPIACGAVELADGKVELIKYCLNYDFDFEYLSFKTTKQLYNKEAQNSYVIYTVQNIDDFDNFCRTVSRMIFLENNKVHCNFGKDKCKWFYKDQDGSETQPMDDKILEKWSPRLLTPSSFAKEYKR